MNKLLATILIVLVISSVAFFGCKGRVEKSPESTGMETPVTASQEEASQALMTEPLETVATEPIPPTAAPQITGRAVALPAEKTARDMDIQRALKIAGFYSGAIDGKIGPRTKRAIEEFQRVKGLKVDGKVGPRTWVELEKYLQQR